MARGPVSLPVTHSFTAVRDSTGCERRPWGPGGIPGAGRAGPRWGEAPLEPCWAASLPSPPRSAFRLQSVLPVPSKTHRPLGRAVLGLAWPSSLTTVPPPYWALPSEPHLVA